MRPSRVLLASLFALGITGCKPTPASGGATGGSTTTTAPSDPDAPQMPAPLKLPEQPPSAFHLHNPAEILTAVGTYAPETPDGPRQVLRQFVAETGGPFEGKLVDHVDLNRRWDAAVVGEQTIIHLPIAAGHEPQVEAVLADLAPEGKFGAVKIPRQGEAGPKLAYFNRDKRLLTLADTLQGIATGPELNKAYGRHPLYVTMTSAEAERRFGSPLPLSRVTIRGKGPHQFQIETEGGPTDVPGIDQISEGALTGVLDAPQVALGASTKYAHYDRDVKQILGQARRQVEAQNFLVRGTLDDLLKRFSSVVRKWNGRVMVGVGPKRHLLVALGANDPRKAESATLHLIRGVLDNIKLAKTFGLGGLPKIRLNRKRTRGGNTDVHVLILEKAAKNLPAQLHPLIDDRGFLRIAMAFPKRNGGVMMAIGPQGADVLKSWLDEVADATPASESRSDLLAATVAVKPETLTTALADQSGAKALRLNAETDPTKIIVTRRGNGYKAKVRGPRIAAAAKRTAPKRTGPAPKRTQPQRGAKGRQPTRAPRTKL